MILRLEIFIAPRKVIIDCVRNIKLIHGSVCWNIRRCYVIFVGYCGRIGDPTVEEGVAETPCNRSVAANDCDGRRSIQDKPRRKEIDASVFPA